MCGVDFIICGLAVCVWLVCVMIEEEFRGGVLCGYVSK